MQFIIEGGWGVLPASLFGLLSLALALSFAQRGQRSTLLLVAGFSVATLLFGFLGTITGVQSAVRYVSANAAQTEVFLVGLREALNSLVIAFSLTSLSTLVATIGLYRNREALTRPLQATT